MNRVYEHETRLHEADQREDIAGFLLSDEIKETILRRIYSGSDGTTGIDPDLFRQMYDVLDNAIGKSFGVGVKWGEADREFLTELRHNTAVFAAFKAHREQNDIASMLIDEDGNRRSFDAFRKATEPIIGSYNVNWLRTEYNAAIRNARTARRWMTYVKDADLFPNLRWLPSRAAEPRYEHRLLWNTVRAITDPWWETTYPGCLWNCQCDVEQTTDPITHVGDTPVDPNGVPTNPSSPGKMRAPGLSRNPYYSRSLFSEDHPYVPQSCSSCRIGKTIGNLCNAGKDCFQCSEVERALWNMRISMKLEEAKKSVLDELTKSGLINADIRNSSLDKRRFSMSKDVYDRYMAHTRNSEEAWILLTLPSNLHRLRNRVKSELGENKNLLDPPQIRNIERKRERGVKYYNIYEYEYMGTVWFIGMEVSKIDKKWKEEPYFIKMK